MKIENEDQKASGHADLRDQLEQARTQIKLLDKQQNNLHREIYELRMAIRAMAVVIAEQRP